MFHLNYYIPFHCLPPMTWEPSEFPLCSLKSLKAEAIQQEVDNMLSKETLSSCGRFSIPFVCTLLSLLQFYQDLRNVIKWEKSDLELKHQTQYLGMLVYTIWETAYPSHTLIGRF